ncbi:pyroglutamyl-peptidase I [Arcanobacterium phocae]|uniref:pyroglutamyl-peptidase I family protein n=1 Tax=Arcanobacterium phocae TaxID=131112 RepID=UPI001C0F0EC1|nr:pyroglutamyl-peptidase I [Arcanobacterium phocae]
MRILLTGFEPFGDDSENASWEAVKRLPMLLNDDDSKIEIITRKLPVVFATAPVQLRQFIADVNPDILIAVGEAGLRDLISVEMIAKNCADARIPDNDGYQPHGEPLDDGEAEWRTRLPAKEIVTALCQAGLPAVESYDAGLYLCNAVFRAALRLFDGPAGFIHVPAVRQAGQASVGSETDSYRSQMTTLDTHVWTVPQLTDALSVVCQIAAADSARA